MSTFQAFIVNKNEDSFSTQLTELSLEDLDVGDVTIEVHYSGVNYKDGLASIPNGNVVQKYPIVPGIDLAGIVLESDSDFFQAGQEVLVTGYGLGISQHGGFSEIARVPHEWVVPLPTGLSMREAMIIGTAGFTAALSIDTMEKNGLHHKEESPLLITRATGGVGSMALAMLHKLGYQNLTASSRKTEANTEHFLRKLGAKEVVHPDSLLLPKPKALAKQKWDGVIDPVAGDAMNHLIPQMNYRSNYALSGLTAGINLQTTVFPFILRGVNLLGIDSVMCPKYIRWALWERIATDMKPNHLDEMVQQEISLEQLPAAFETILKGGMTGRTLVKVS